MNPAFSVLPIFAKPLLTTGIVIVFVTPRERRMLESLERVSGRPVEQMPVPTPDEVNARRADRFAGSITNAMGDPQFSVYRGLVEQYAQEHDVDMTEIAAALAVMSQDDKEFFPKYNVTMVLDEQTSKEYPQLEDLFAPVIEKLTDKVMIELNAEVDVNGREPADVAYEWLRDEGFVEDQ